MQRFRLPNYRPPISSQSFTRWVGRLVLLTLGVLAIGLLVGFVRMTWAEHKINQESAQQEAANEAQKQRNAALKGEAEFRESGMYAEQAAREQLGMARDGETVLLPTVVLPAASQPAPPPPAANAAAPEIMLVSTSASAPNYQRWWQALFPGPAASP